MEESWEEKTERLEREYQARIDRLREELREARDIAGVVATNVREIGEGAMAQLKSENAALTKRVAELEERLHVMTLQEKLARESNGHLQQVAMAAKEDLRDLQSQLEAKDKRVAELERFAKPGSYWFTRATELESQLAWTPVSAGLPTEPGVYYLQFRTTAKYKLKLYEDGESFSWTLLERPVADHPTEFDEYRCIELPKDGGT